MHTQATTKNGYWQAPSHPMARANLKRRLQAEYETALAIGDTKHATDLEAKLAILIR